MLVQSYRIFIGFLLLTFNLDSWYAQVYNNSYQIDYDDNLNRNALNSVNYQL
jgi:hypothetical protein